MNWRGNGCPRIRVTLAPVRFGCAHSSSSPSASVLSSSARLACSAFERVLRGNRRVSHARDHVELSGLPGYMDQFVGASFLPHTNPDVLRMG